MSFSKCCLGVVVLCCLSTAAMAKTKGPTLRDREQAACFNDANKLCGEFIPDETKITACMTAKLDQVSATCRKFFKTSN